MLTTLKTLQAGALQTRSGVFVLSVLFSTGLVLVTSQSIALTKLSDNAMADVSGAGLAFSFDDFRFQMEPTSFFENIGATPNRVPGATNGYKGDYRWIGTTISRGYPVDGSGNIDYTKLYNFSDYINATGGKFNMNPTSTASAAAAIEYKPMGWVTGDPMQTLSYPIAQGGAQGYAEVNNPFVMRVHSYNAVGLDAARTNWIGGVDHTVLELVGATHSTPFRWAFWGQVDAVQDTYALKSPGVVTDASLVGGTTAGRLENQEIIIGSPTSRFKPDGSNPAGDGTGIEIGCTGGGSGITGCANPNYKIMGPVFRMYQSMGEGNNDQTLGMLYHHRLQGDYRFSVNEPGSRTAEGGARIPTFDAQEGMYFMHVNAYLPMGQLHYQSLVVSGVKDGSGNYTGDFITETSQLPNDPNAYNDFYGYPANGANTTAPAGSQLGFNRNNLKDRYYETHGYVRWGDNFPTSAEAIAQLGNGDATKVTNGMPGSGVANTKGWSGTGVTSGGSINVTYHLPSYAINSTNFLNIYNAGTLGLGSVDLGLCEGGRDKYCDWQHGSTVDVQRTIPINVTTPSPNGSKGTIGELMSAGGMVFVARNGGSWTLPQNPNLASTIASQGTNLLIFNNWEVKKALTSTGEYGCDWTGCDGWELYGNTSPNGGTLDAQATNVINAAGGASATMTINGINLGSSRVEGMLIHHLKVTTLGAAN